MAPTNVSGLFAPAGVPKPIVDRLAQLTKAAVAEPEVQKALLNSGFEPIDDSGPEQAQRTVAAELARWTPIIKATGFTQ